MFGYFFPSPVFARRQHNKQCSFTYILCFIQLLSYIQFKAEQISQLIDCKEKRIANHFDKQLKMSVIYIQTHIYTACVYSDQKIDQ